MLRQLVALFLAASLLPAAAPAARLAGPVIGQVVIDTPVVARYDRFEAHFTLQTTAAYLNLPFDPQPPKGAEKLDGVSVDALFTSPSGIAYTQPAFFYQPYRSTVRGGQDHRIPQGDPRWAVRFTPQEEGTWQLRIRAADRSGTSTTPQSPILSFKVEGTSRNPYKQRGFLQVSQADPRYFEFQDGTPFTAAGFNAGFRGLEDTARRMQDYEKHKINFLRTWMSGDGINGSQWTPWASFHLSFDGYLPPVSLDSANHAPGSELSFKLDSSNPCLFQGWQQGPIAVEAGKSYTVWARVKTRGVSGNHAQTGFVIKTGGWLDKQCRAAASGVQITTPLSGDRDWTEVTGSLRAAGDFLDNLYLVLQEASSGEVYIDQVRLYRSDDPDRVNILRQPDADSHLSFDPQAASRWDDILILAEQHGVYLKLVVDEKNEWIRNRITAEGRFTSTPDNQNFYAQPGTKVRWLQQAWWRYIIARWGYSTAIHSLEYVNEGDPYNENHYQAAAEMAQTFDQLDPARHMVTTSFWHSFPNKEFWSNPAYQAIDYADLHAYITTGWGGGTASFLNHFSLDPNPANNRGALPSVCIEGNQNLVGGITPRGLVLNEKGEWIIRYWMRAENFQANCSYKSTGGMQRLRWLIDGGPYHGGQEGVVPADAKGQSFVCTSPAGTFPWKQLRSDQDRDGRPTPQSARIIISDDHPHEISISIENLNGIGGTAWINQVELISPSGKIVPVLGQFDMTPMVIDTAWYNNAYGSLLGPASPVGVKGKPLVRGEGGIDSPSTHSWLPELNRDREGVWLHNNVWAQIASGGMIDLMWWSGETISENSQTGRSSLYPVFLAYRNFMDGIPVNNGKYQEINAAVSDPRLRAWGQVDTLNRRGHLWLQNRSHTWQAAVSGMQVPAISGTVTLHNMPAGRYRIEWWDTYRTDNPISKTETAAANGGMLVLQLPAPLTTDIAVKIFPQP